MNLDHEISEKVDQLFSLEGENSLINVADKGLGFHAPKKRDEKKIAQKKSFKLNNQVFQGQKNISQMSVPKTKSDDTFAGEASVDLNIFNQVGQNNEVKISSLEEEKVQLNPSKPDKVFFAWFVDTLIVLLVIAAAMIMLFTLTGIPLSNLSQFLSHKSSIGFVSLFFLVFYLIYFSILDLGTSPGKALLGTSIESTNESQLRLSQTFTRALIQITSIFFLFIPLYFGLHNEWSQTRSVEDNW